MKNIHNAVSDTMDDLDLYDFITYEIDDIRNIVTFRYKDNANKFLHLRVSERNRHVYVMYAGSEGLTDSFRTVLFESLAISLDPDYYDDMPSLSTNDQHLRRRSYQE